LNFENWDFARYQNKTITYPLTKRSSYDK